MDDQVGGRISTKLREQIFLILRLASIGAYNGAGELRDTDGRFVPGTDIVKMIDHAFTPDKSAEGEDLFVKLLRSAKINPDSIVNKRMKDALIGNQSSDAIDSPARSSYTGDTSEIVTRFTSPTPPPMNQVTPTRISSPASDTHGGHNATFTATSETPKRATSSFAPRAANGPPVIQTRAPSGKTRTPPVLRPRQIEEGAIPSKKAVPLKKAKTNLPVVSTINLERRKRAEQLKQQRGKGAWLSASDSE